jgi:acetylornithine deacetylase
MTIPIDREYLTQTLAGLVRINSINPTLVPGGAGEAEIAAYTADSLRSIGLDTAIHEPQPGRPSVVGILRGDGGGRSLMLNAHYDTVGVAGMAEPFSGAVQDGRLYGRGAYDMKGSLAAGMAAAKALVDAGVSLAGDLLVAAVADEEYASLGTADLIERYEVDAAIVTEPTELDICLAHKGFIWLEVETLGRAAHGSRFDLGVDANMRMGRFLTELEELERALRARPGHPLVGPPSLHAAMIEGGTELSAYAARCRLRIERRTIPGETEEQVMAELQTIVDRLAAADPSFQATLRSFFVREPFEVSPGAAIVQSLSRAAERVLGRTPRMVGDTPWMDSAMLAAAGVETVVIGPAGAGSHSHEEWVEVESVVRLAEILAETARSYCQL